MSSLRRCGNTGGVPAKAELSKGKTGVYCIQVRVYIMNKQQTAKPKRRMSCCSGCATLFLLLFCLIVLGFAGSYYVAANTIHRQLVEKYPPPGKMVDIGGYSLHLYCMGQGEPTVVVDVGWLVSSPNWQNVQSLLSKKYRTCLFDRAGRAWSDPSSRPRQIQVMAEELHSTLSKVGIKSPYILIGEGEAALYARYYATQYPNEVRGLELITPVLANPSDWAGYDRPNVFIWTIEAPLDVLTWFTSGKRQLSATDPGCKSTENCKLENLWNYEIKNQQATSAELDLWVENNTTVDKASAKLGSLPLIVVYPKNYYETASMKKLDALLALSTKSTAQPQKESNIREEAPDAITNAVEWLLR